MSYDTEKFIERAKINRFFKYNGKLFNYSLNEKGMLELILYKGTKKDPKIFVLTSFNKELNKNVLEMIEKGCIKRFSVRFEVIFKEYNQKWFSSIVLRECEEWKNNKINIGSYKIDESNNVKIEFGVNINGEFE